MPARWHLYVVWMFFFFLTCFWTHCSVCTHSQAVKIFQMNVIEFSVPEWSACCVQTKRVLMHAEAFACRKCAACVQNRAFPLSRVEKAAARQTFRLGLMCSSAVIVNLNKNGYIFRFSVTLLMNISRRLNWNVFSLQI